MKGIEKSPGLQEQKRRAQAARASSRQTRPPRKAEPLLTKSKQSSGRQPGRWMDSITEFTALAELKLLNKIREELKVFVAELPPELDLQLLAKQVRSYFAYADKPVHLYHGGREVVRTFWYCLLHPEFQIVDQDELEEGYFQLNLFPDFQLLHPMILRWYEHAVELNVEWSKAKEITDIALRKLSRSGGSESTVPPTGPLHIAPVQRTRDPYMAARYSIISSAFSRQHPISAFEICKLFDYHNIPVPEPWKEAGLNNWVEAYQDVDYRGNVQKLISVHKKTLRTSTR